MSKYQHSGAFALVLFLAAAGIAAVVSGISQPKAVADGGARTCGGPLVSLRPYMQASHTPVSTSPHATCELSHSLDER